MASSMSTYLKPVMLWLNRLSGWLLLLAIGWLCWSLARLLWLLLAAPQAPSLPIAPIESAQITPIDYASSFMLFEQPQPVTAPSKPPPNVVLKGVMLATPESFSSALLEVDGQVSNYRLGESLENSSYKLVAVAWNEVILEDAASQQVVITLTEPMALDQGQVTANAPSGPISNRRLPVSNNRLDEQMQPEMPSSGAPETNESAQNSAQNNDPQSAITQAVEALQQNPASYLSRMGVMATGEGYQVTDAMPAKLKNRLGLEPGDKVISVNGQAVGSNPGQDASLLEQIKQSGEAQIEVQRGEQVITIRQQF